MKSPNNTVSTASIGDDFCYRKCSYIETYHRLRLKGFGKSFAIDLLRKWVNERIRLETIFGKGKE